jgi:large conductance mechanosensitive channel
LGKQESYGVNLELSYFYDKKGGFMSVLKEFRDFAVKGNVIDLAVGVIIGGAFGKIVDSLVNDIVMPVISTLLGGHIDFTNLFIILGQVPENVPRNFDALKKAGIPIFAYGNFITIAINFILLAFVIFQMVKLVNRIRIMDAEPAPSSPATPEDIMLLREIRDNLKK